MSKKNQLYQSIINQPNLRSFWGQEFLRDVLLPDLLGNDTESILYWAGKKISHQYAFKTPYELIRFFQQTGWGSLHLKKKSSQEITWQLNGKLVANRLKNPKSNFTLEAGFLATQAEQNTGVDAEATVNRSPKNQKTVLINIHLTLPNQK